MKIKKLSIAIALVLSLCTLQFGALGSAYADTNTDLSISGGRDMANQAIGFNVCNNGPTDIKQINFSIDATNITFDQIFVSPFDQPVSDNGTFDKDTLIWTGLLSGQTLDGNNQTVTQCLPLKAGGHDSGNLGDSVTTTVSILSSVQVDDTVNVDSSGNESITYDPYTVVAQPDLNADSHIITRGAITPTSEVEYGIDISNIGDGAYHDNDFNIFAFTLPADATFVSATDLNTGDIVDASSDNIDPNLNNCFSGGVLGVDIVLPGLGDYAGRHVMVCQLKIEGGVIPAHRDVYPFKIKIIAGQAMASGDADVVGILEGNDKDTMNLIGTIARGEELVDTLTNNPNNNIIHLSYDPNALQMTAARCAGYSENTSDGTGCFNVTFNKDIYEPSFTTSSLSLNGSGHVDSLENLGNGTWKVMLSGITSTTTLQLVDSTSVNSVQDKSAIIGNTFVLGETTFRYADTVANDTPVVPVTPNEQAQAAGKTSANGVLASTGTDADFTTPLTLLILGLGICFALRRKKTIA